MPFFYATRRDGDRVEILGPDARHLAGPLRARPGELIAVVDPAGSLLTVRLDAVSSREVAGSVVASRPHDPEPRLQVTMALALLPAAALEHSLSRSTELGAHAFLLVAADRSVARAAKLERWATICREAAMLAGRLVVPAVAGPVSLREVLAGENVAVLDAAGTSRLAAASFGSAGYPRRRARGRLVAGRTGGRRRSPAQPRPAQPAGGHGRPRGAGGGARRGRRPVIGLNTSDYVLAPL